MGTIDHNPHDHVDRFGHRTARRFFPRDAGRGAGYTLVEVLVVVCILTIVAAIALPMVGAARESARSMTCLNNLRQIGIGALAYAATYDGYTVPGYADERTKIPAYNGFADAENYATMLVNEGLVTAPRLRDMAGGISPEASFFRCPSGSDQLGWTEFCNANSTAPYPKGRRDPLCGRPQRTRSRRSGLVVDTWYGVNATLDRFGSSKTPCRRIPDDDTMLGPRDTWNWTLPRLRDLPDPSRMVFLFDGVFMNLHNEPDRLQARHGREDRTNLLFFDGHAQSVPTADLPGGLGPNPAGAGDKFADVPPNAPVLWRLDQR